MHFSRTTIAAVVLFSASGVLAIPLDQQAADSGSGHGDVVKRNPEPIWGWGSSSRTAQAQNQGTKGNIIVHAGKCPELNNGDIICCPAKPSSKIKTYNKCRSPQQIPQKGEFDCMPLPGAADPGPAVTFNKFCCTAAKNRWWSSDGHKCVDRKSWKLGENPQSYQSTLGGGTSGAGAYGQPQYSSSGHSGAQQGQSQYGGYNGGRQGQSQYGHGDSANTGAGGHSSAPYHAQGSGHQSAGQEEPSAHGSSSGYGRNEYSDSTTQAPGTGFGGNESKYQGGGSQTSYPSSDDSGDSQTGYTGGSDTGDY